MSLRNCCDTLPGTVVSRSDGKNIDRRIGRNASFSYISTMTSAVSPSHSIVLPRSSMTRMGSISFDGFCSRLVSELAVIDASLACSAVLNSRIASMMSAAPTEETCSADLPLSVAFFSISRLP